MNVSNLANLFQQNSIFQQSRPLGQKLGQPPISDTLHRLSQNFLTAQEQGQDLRKRFDTLELSAEAAGSKADSALSEMPRELLEVYLNQYKVAANLSHQNEAALMEYRDQLSAFDQTIQEYQDMLDGKAALPQQMKMEDVSMLLERTRAAREQFLQTRQGSVHLGPGHGEIPPCDSHFSRVTGGHIRAAGRHGRGKFVPGAEFLPGRIKRGRLHSSGGRRFHCIKGGGRSLRGFCRLKGRPTLRTAGPQHAQAQNSESQHSRPACRTPPDPSRPA